MTGARAVVDLGQLKGVVDEAFILHGRMAAVMLFQGVATDPVQSSVENELIKRVVGRLALE